MFVYVVYVYMCLMGVRGWERDPLWTPYGPSMDLPMDPLWAPNGLPMDDKTRRAVTNACM